MKNMAHHSFDSSACNQLILQVVRLLATSSKPDISKLVVDMQHLPSHCMHFFQEVRFE